MSSHPTPPSSEAASQNHSEPDHKKGHATVGAAQLIALGKAMGDAQSEKIEILTQQTEIFIQQIDTLIQQIENFIQRLREHDTRIMNAGDEQLSDISRSSVSTCVIASYYTALTRCQ